MKENEIESDVDSTKCDLSTALDTDVCSEVKKSDTNYENETKNVSQSKDLWDYPSVRKWSWTLILKSIGEQTLNEIIKCNSCLDPSCMNKAQNNMKQVTHHYDQLLILFKQAFELIEKMLSNISENEYKKLTNADWKKFFWVFNPDEDWSNLKRELMNQANKQYSSLKIRNKTADIIAEDITTYLDHISWKNAELLCNNHSEWELPIFASNIEY